MKFIARLVCTTLILGIGVGTAVAQKKKADSGKPSQSSTGAQSSTQTKSTSTTSQNYDYKVRPSFGDIPQIEFPEYKETTLKNGLKVIVIEDHKQPTFTMRLQIKAGDNLDGDKSGIAFLMTNLLTKGTKKRTAYDIANQTDSLGASMTVNSTGELATLTLEGLTKHLPFLTGLYADVVTNPTFPKEEFDKLIPQVLAGIKQEKSRPMELAQKLSRMVLYGKNNPSSRFRTEKSIQSITQEDVMEFHKKWFRPNNSATLAISGDVSLNQIVGLLNSAFSRWESNPSIKSEPPTQPKPMEKGVYFIQRPGSVQSTIMMCNFAPARKDPNYERLQLATSLIGGGFAGRLFKTLRETYSFTYTPFGFMTQGKYYNRFVAGADVRTAVTDSAIMVLRREISKVAEEPAKDEEFDLIKQMEVSQYLMGFEKSDFVAAILQNAEYLEIEPEIMKSYAQRLAAYSPFDAQRSAERFLRPDLGYLVVVGSPEILPVLEKYGRVFSYNLDLEPVADNMEKVSMSVDDLLKKHAQAIGNIASVQTMVVNSKATLDAGGQKFEGKSVRTQKSPNKKHFKAEFAIGNQEQWIDGTKAYSSMNDLPANEMKDDNAKDALAESAMFFTTKLPSLGFKCEITGKQGNQIIMKVVSPSGQDQEYYFDAKTYLLNRVDKIRQMPNGPVSISEFYTDYTDVNGVKLPKNMKLDAGGMIITYENTYQLNTPVDDKVFKP